jgi:hypothetical protein
MKRRSTIAICLAFITAAFAADTVHITTSSDIAAVMQSNTTAGTVFYIHEGEYRGVGELPVSAGQEVVGELGPNGERLAVFNGSVLLTNWEQEGKYWVHENVEPTGVSWGVCWMTRQKACKTPDNLYMDNLFLREVDTLQALDSIKFDRLVYPHIGPYEQQAENQHIEHGTWFFDHNLKKIYMLDDPTGHKMEKSQTKRLRGGAENAVIKNIVVEKYATPLQGGAVSISAAGSVLDNVESRLNHGIGMAIYGDAPGLVIRNCHTHHNAQLGIKLQSTLNAVVENTIVNNNDLHRTIGSWWGEEGGIKVVSNNVNPTLRNNWVYRNWGKGLWFDGHTRNGTITGNLCEDNAELGVFLEIMDTLTDSGVVSYNIVRRNGYCLWFYGAQIMTSASKNCHIHHNVVYVDPTHDANSVTMIWQIDDSYRYTMSPKGSSVKYNDITFGGIGICEDRPEADAGGKFMKYGFALSTWGGSLNTPEKKQGAFAAQKDFLQTCGVIFDYNSFHVPAGYDRASWYWPPLEADADGDGETDGKLMNWYSFEDFQVASGQDKNSTLDNDVDTTSVRQLLKLKNMGAPLATIEQLAKYLNLDPNNLSIRPQALAKKIRESARSIGFGAGKIHLRLPAADTYVVGLYDSRGRAMFRTAYTVAQYGPDKSVAFNTASLAHGVYTISIDGKIAGRTVRNITLMGRNAAMK